MGGGWKGGLPPRESCGSSAQPWGMTMAYLMWGLYRSHRSANMEQDLLERSIDPSGIYMSAPQPFASTRWSLIVAAKGCDEPEAHRALAELCQIYWFPLYGYV